MKAVVWAQLYEVINEPSSSGNSEWPARSASTPRQKFVPKYYFLFMVQEKILPQRNMVVTSVSSWPSSVLFSIFIYFRFPLSLCFCFSVFSSTANDCLPQLNLVLIFQSVNILISYQQMDNRQISQIIHCNRSDAHVYK